VDERPDGDDRTAELYMLLTNKKGKQRERNVITYRKDEDEDSKTVMFFLEPADVKNTGFLTWSYDDESKDDDQWLYLPALKKVRRISSGNKSDYFMGTDFTYNDMGDAEVDDYTHTLLGTEVIDGIECHHVEQLPKDDDVLKEQGYGRIEAWVRPDIWVLVKANFFDRKLKPLKELTVSDIEQIDGIWTPKTMIMKNLQTKHQTEFRFSNIHYNTGLDDSIFSQRSLTKGIR
jgi:outer membrane lipoprotein-sorting protein